VPNRIKGLDGGSIGSDNSNPIERVRVSTPVNSATAEAAPSPPQGDSVHVSDSARAMASLAQAVSDTPDVNMGRVTQIQQSITTGSYRVNPERIADSMLRLERELDGTKQR
jgi:negative regulator of flagellin synthesis FlgM